MYKYVMFIVLFVLSCALTVYAQEISSKDLQSFRSQTRSPEFMVKQNVISNNALGTIALSRVAVEDLDKAFSHVIKRGPVTDQQRSGRCWLFAGFNVIRYDMALKLNVANFEFSENYLFFFHKLELSNVLLEQAIITKADFDDPGLAWQLRNGLSDGGYWDMFTFLVQKYGAVPASVMPETVHSSNTKDLNDMLDRLVKRHVVEIVKLRKQDKSVQFIRKYKSQALSDIYQVLALMLGTPPEQFKWRYVNNKKQLMPYQTYTPKSFIRQYLGDVFDSKVHLINDPSLPYYKLYVLENATNIVEFRARPFLNVPIGVVVDSTKRSIKLKRPVWFGSDVAKHADFKSGILDVNRLVYEKLFGIRLEMSKSDRLMSYATAATHAMVFFGMDLGSDGQPVKWLIENSWGSQVGDGGYLIATKSWFEEHVFDVIVDRKSVSPVLLEYFNTPVVELPSWHHLWKP